MVLAVSGRCISGRGLVASSHASSHASHSVGCNKYLGPQPIGVAVARVTTSALPRAVDMRQHYNGCKMGGLIALSNSCPQRYITLLNTSTLMSLKWMRSYQTIPLAYSRVAPKKPPVLESTTSKHHDNVSTSIKGVADALARVFQDPRPTCMPRPDVIQDVDQIPDAATQRLTETKLESTAAIRMGHDEVFKGWTMHPQSHCQPYLDVLPTSVPSPSPISVTPDPTTKTSPTCNHLTPNQPALVLLHGLFGGKRHWQALSIYLAHALSLPVYAVDLRFHGDTAWYHDHLNADMNGVDQSDLDAGLHAMALDVERFLGEVVAAAGHSSVILIGHSMVHIEITRAAVKDV